MLGLAYPAAAQIELDSNGRVGIGSSAPVSTSQVYLKSAREHGLKLNLDGVGSGNAYGVYSFIQNGYASYRFALWGKAQGSSTQSYGLHATGTGASNQNFGAYGSATGGSQAYGVYGVASGASTNYAGYFFGNVYATGTVTQLSDSRFKRDITTISSETKSALLELKPLTYRFANVNELAAAGLPRASLADGVHYGLIAQEVQAVLPDLVSQEILAIPAEDLSTQDVPVQTLGVNYSELIPILIAVIQDQQAQIEALQAAVRGAGIDVPDATSGNN